MEMPNTDTSGKTPLFVANLIVTIISVCFMWLVIPIISFVASLLGVIFSSRMSNWNSAKKQKPHYFCFDLFGCGDFDVSGYAFSFNLGEWNWASQFLPSLS